MRKKFIIEGLDCASCAAKIEEAICKIDGVQKATVSFLTQKLIIEAEEAKMPNIIVEAEKAVKEIEPDTTIKTA